MKGLTHFLTGAATATFFPSAVQATVNERSWIIMLGGLMGIMADTLDFRVSRYFFKSDYDINLSEDNLDPEIVASTVAKAIKKAHETQKTVSLKLNTLKVSANYYRTYSVAFDNENKELTARIGPLKSLGQTMGGGRFQASDGTRRKKYSKGKIRTRAEKPLFEKDGGRHFFRS